MCERLWRAPGKSYIRVLPEALGVVQKGYTRRLERIVCDFAWDQSFHETNARLREHYGFELCVERIRQTALRHAQRIEQACRQRDPVGALPAQGADWIVTSADGTMVRLVRTGKEGDRRKTRQLEWKEARLAAAQAHGAKTITYEATLGSVKDLGERWAQAVRQAHWGANSNIYSITDGAPWLYEQATQNLGQNHRHFLDLYHVCQYLAAAAPACAGKEGPARWLTRHKNMLLKGKLDNVLSNLRKNHEPSSCADEDAPARLAHRYLSKRRESLDYPFALQHKLPVGSGIIEGGNRHVIQKRLKGSGMAWAPDSAQAMIQARCIKCSGLIEPYWQECTKIAA